MSAAGVDQDRRGRARYAAMLLIAALVTLMSMSTAGAPADRRATALLPMLVGLAVCHKLIGPSLRSRTAHGEAEAFLLCAATVATVAWLLAIVFVLALLLVAAVV
ncbi:MAG: hypothetical protein ACR2NB_10055 [Solirubrobacteraceae bacterium]